MEHTKEQQSYFTHKGSTISITEFNSLITKTYKESRETAFKYADEFINNNPLSFSDTIRVLKKIIPYYVKSKSYSFEEIENYVFSELSKFGEKNDPDSIIQISELLHRIKNSYGIDYLNNKLISCESDTVNNISFFDTYVLLSDFYFEENDLESSFKTLRRALALVTNFQDHFDYLWKQKVFAEKAANICFNDNPPKYAEYLYFDMVAFALDTARGLTAFPIHSLFSFRYDHHFCEVLNDNELADISFEELKIKNYKTEIVNEFINFVYNKLPVIYGIPIKYLSVKKTSEVIRNMGKNYNEWVALSELSQKIKNTYVDGLNLEINEFVSQLLGRYLNQTGDEL